MITINVTNLKKSYGVKTIFENVSFAVEDREKVAIVGPNGCGKTTLFNVISGQEKQDAGDIYISKDLKLGFMEQNVSITSDKKVIDMVLEVFEDVRILEKEIEVLHKKIAKYSSDEDKLKDYYKIYTEKIEQFEEMDGYSYNSLAKGILIGLGFKEEELQKEVKLLSGGEKSRLSLAKLLLQKPDILLLDEPTNHLDMDSISWLESFLKGYDATTLIISHDRYFMDNLTARTIDMTGGKATVYNVPYSKYKEKKDEIYQKKLKDYYLNQEEIKRQEEIIFKLKSFGREKQIKRARSRQKLLDKMEKVDKPYTPNLKSNIVFTSSQRSGNDVLTITSLSKSYAGKKLFENFSMDVYRGEKIAFVGANGSGKTTLFRILLGQEEQDTGQYLYGNNVNPKYFNQERIDLGESNTVIEELWDEYPHLTQTKVRTYLAGFLFTGDDVFKDVKDLSGGEKSRLSLLKLMLSKSNFLFMDEPTNHLDIDSKEVLEDAICAYDSTVFVISHDRYLLNKVPDRIFAFEDGKIVEYLGNYDYMMDKKKEMEEIKQYKEEQNREKITRTSIKEEKKRSKEQKKILSTLKREEKEITQKIEDVENHIKTLDIKLCQEEVYTDSEKTKKVITEKNDYTEKLQNLYKKWEEINEKIENY